MRSTAPNTLAATFTTANIRQAITGLSLDDTEAAVTLTSNIFQANATDIFVDCGSTPTLTTNIATVVRESPCL